MMERWPQRAVLEPALQLFGFDAPSIDGLKEYDVKKVAIAAANVVKHCSGGDIYDRVSKNPR